jgi:hypothetical protein
MNCHPIRGWRKQSQNIRIGRNYLESVPKVLSCLFGAMAFEAEALAA